MLADFREYYNLNLADVLRFDGSLPVWEAATLAKQLPPSSRTAAAMQGGSEYWGWTIDRYLLTALLDALNANTYAFVAANSKKKPKPPKLTPRPGDEERKQQAKMNNPFALTVQRTLQNLDKK